MERADLEQWKGKEVARLLSLVETERRYYQEMVAALPVALAVLAADRSVVSANRAFRQLFGLSTEDLRRKSIEQILPADEATANRLIEKIRDVNVNGIPQPGFLLEMGEKLFRISILPIRNWNDEMEMETLLTAADVSDVRAGAGATIAAASPQVSFPTESFPAVVWRADAATLRFTEVGGAAEGLLGYPAAKWLAPADFFAERIHPEDRAATLAHYRAAVGESRDASAEFRAITAAGETIWCRETVRVSRQGLLSGVCAAVTQRKQIEWQRVAAERTAALQGLSAQLAHDLNNPLMIVTGYAEEMLHGLNPDDVRRADVEQILGATRRMEAITAQMLQFTRKQAEAPRSLDIAAVLSGLRGTIARTAGEGVTIAMNPAGPVWASADRKQLEGIVLALVSAAREDAPHGATITIACDPATIAELVETDSAAPFKPGSYARLTVHASGPAMDVNQQPGVFESFLIKEQQTKDQSASAMATLAHAYAVVREWDGDIAFQSEGSRGVTFMVYLPWADPPAVPAPSRAVAVGQHPSPALRPDSWRETILVVDDEPGIRALVAKILRRERYIVLEAGSAEEAMTVTLIHGAPIHLLLSDVMLPDRSGRQIAEQLHEFTAGIKVIYISGFTDDESVRTGDFPPGSRFLQKPFTLGALVSTVREALDSK
jgi:two-component system, cell cycle sensor histidine kinase and response regulator CckA